MDMTFSSRTKRYFLTGLLVLLPAWGTYLILVTLFDALDHLLVDLFGSRTEVPFPGWGIIFLVLLILIAGMVTTLFLGERWRVRFEKSLEQIPIVGIIYNTLKSMADVFHFRERFKQSPVVAFPFPREGLWALGFVMGVPPAHLQVAPDGPLLMVFVPTAIHPFTGYLAFVPQSNVRRIRLHAYDAMKMEFSAGLYRPRPGWLSPLAPNR